MTLFRTTGLVSALCFFGFVSWLSYDSLHEAYGSGPPYYGRTVNMDKWHNPIPGLLMLDGLALLMSALAVLLDYGGSRSAIAAVLGKQSIQRQLLSLVRRQLIRISHGDQGPVYQLHTIMQTFYYDALIDEQRQRMHREAARYYETAGRDPLLAARHYVHSGDYSRAASLTWLIVSRGQVRLLRALLHDPKCEGSVLKVSV